MGTAVVGVFVIAAFAAMGALERFRNGRALRRMPLRVNVNGIRGKSTVTRLVTAILAEEGYNVVGKTTGTAARMIYGLDREEPIVRKPEGANIKEQVVCIDKAARHGANAMVCECMAVRPEYQTVVQERMLRANVCVIVNILEDHLDVMGPTELQIAEAFSKSIPRRGYCVTVPGPYLYVLERECVKRGSELVVVDESEVPEEYIARFPYEIFPANVALAIGVARVLGISREVAERGALLAKPDPGAAQIVDAKDNDLVFVNGFAANEPSSSWTIWDRMESKGATEKGVVVKTTAALTASGLRPAVRGGLLPPPSRGHGPVLHGAGAFLRGQGSQGRTVLRRGGVPLLRGGFGGPARAGGSGRGEVPGLVRVRDRQHPWGGRVRHLGGRVRIRLRRRRRGGLPAAVRGEAPAVDGPGGGLRAPSAG